MIYLYERIMRGAIFSAVFFDLIELGIFLARHH